MESKKPNNNNNNPEGVNNPLEHGLKTVDFLFKSNEKKLKAATFISTAKIVCNLYEHKLPNQDKFFYQVWNRTFLVAKQKGKLKVNLAANFIVTDVKECTLVYNDKSGKKPLKYYIVTLQNANGKIEADVEIANNSKSDFKQFQTCINSFYNDFAVNMTEAEFKAFVAEFISPKVASTTTIYTNAGLTSDGNILYENALATKNGIIWADDDGYIKTSDNTYIKIAESTHYLPKLAKSVKTGQQIAFELLTNIKECWSQDIMLPLITLGNMVMAIYYNEFIKRHGAPTLILYGETGTGKSTLVTVGLSMFGLSKEALTSGGSTAKSNEYFCSRYNGLNVCIDDVKGETLTSSNFTALIKGIYKGIPRTRSLPYGRGVEYIHTCSPLGYSTNETLSDLKEVVNRLNIVEIFGKIFEAGKFKYHELDKNNKDNLKELSLILPEFLKYSVDDVIKLYNQVFDMLEANIQDTQKRVINNIAYAYTGALMLVGISGVEFGNLQEKVIEYAKKQITKYENIKTPVEKVLSAIVVLHQLRQLENGTHFKIVKAMNEDKEELHIRFHKGVVLGQINKYYAHDKLKRINEDAFTSYAKNHKRYRGNIAVRYEGKKNPDNSIIFDVTGLEEFRDFGSIIEPMSADELRARVQERNNT
ncbi:MAG: hypothetical protein PHY44_08795 [Lachnospiraceae bacterium]|nr:hypothetical protein [Lachnospiraceae bacterium]